MNSVRIYDAVVPNLYRKYLFRTRLLVRQVQFSVVEENNYYVKNNSNIREISQPNKSMSFFNRDQSESIS